MFPLMTFPIGEKKNTPSLMTPRPSQSPLPQLLRSAPSLHWNEGWPPAPNELFVGIGSPKKCLAHHGHGSMCFHVCIVTLRSIISQMLKTNSQFVKWSRRYLRIVHKPTSWTLLIPGFFVSPYGWLLVVNKPLYMYHKYIYIYIYSKLWTMIIPNHSTPVTFDPQFWCLNHHSLGISGSRLNLFSLRFQLYSSARLLAAKPASYHTVKHIQWICQPRINKPWYLLIRGGTPPIVIIWYLHGTLPIQGWHKKRDSIGRFLRDLLRWIMKNGGGYTRYSTS